MGQNDFSHRQEKVFVMLIFLLQLLHLVLALDFLVELLVIGRALALESVLATNFGRLRGVRAELRPLFEGGIRLEDELGPLCILVVVVLPVL